MKIYKSVFFSVLLLLTLCLKVSAQNCGSLPPCTGESWENPGVNCCKNVTVPFDGGISLLLAAGIGIGVRSAYKKRKQSV